MVKLSLVPVTCLALLLTTAGVASAQDSRQAEGQPAEDHQALVFLRGPFARSGSVFAVTVDGGHVDLGSWSRVDGLSVRWDLAPYRPQGTVTLQRAAGDDTLLVKRWLVELALSGERPQMEIALLDSSGEVLVRWTLIAAYPTKWQVSGPDAADSKLLIETLVIQHEGLVLDRR